MTVMPQPSAAAVPEVPSVSALAIRPTDDGARLQARGLMAAARFAALGVIHPETGFPHVTRVLFGLAPDDGTPVTLVSSLSLHHRALAVHPLASLLIGEPGSRGDPLTHPRLTISAVAMFVGADDPARLALRASFLNTHPKTRLYIDFADFSFVRFSLRAGALNGGFGKAFDMGPDDLNSI